MVKGIFSKKEDQGAELLRDKTEEKKASDEMKNDFAKLVVGPKKSEPLIAKVDEFNIDSKLLKDMLTLEEGADTTENPTLKE